MVSRMDVILKYAKREMRYDWISKSSVNSHSANLGLKRDYFNTFPNNKCVDKNNPPRTDFIIPCPHQFMTKKMFPNHDFMDSWDTEMFLAMVTMGIRRSMQ